MAAFSKVLLSGSVNGRPIDVSQTATAGNAVHAAHATALDEVWLYAVSRHTADVILTVEFGGVAPGDTITTLLAPNVPKLVIPGSPLSNSLAVGAFADVASVVSVFGWVNRIG